jgi:Asp-tRNA(Asn)/Glu-tRNA(Gln) amidotransferase A subunit family amidase
VSGDGTHQIAWTIETVGPIARSVADVTRLLAAIADLPVHAERTAIDDLIEGRPVGVAGLRIGVVGGFFADTSDPEIVAAVREVADELDRLGASVGELELRDPEVAVEAGKLMIRADAFAIHEELLRSSPEGYGDDVRRRLELGADVTGAELARAHQEARGWTTQIEDAWRDFDLLLTPTVGEEAPLILGSDMIAQTEAITSLTLPFSLAGVPGLSVPCGLTSGGMPIGAQLVAPRWRDDLVLQAGAAYQQVTDWHRRRP